MPSYAKILVVLASLGCAVQASPGTAQSITTGALVGRVLNEAGDPMGSVRVELRRHTGGVALVVESGPDGAFLFPVVQPGEYELLAERLGYWPMLLSPIPVLAGRRLDVDVTIRRAEEIVRAPNTGTFLGRTLAAASLPGRSHRLTELEQGMPQRRADVGELARFSTVAEDPGQAEGLPRALGGVALSGLPFQPVHNPGSGEELVSLLFPVRALGPVELVAGRPDVEWMGAAGGVMAARVPGRDTGTGAELGGVYGNESLFVDTGPPGFRTWRAGGAAGTYLVQDSAHAWVFGEGSHFETPVDYWRTGVSAYEAAGLDVGPLAGSQSGSIERVNVGGSFDWHFPGGAWVDMVALYGQGEQDHALAGFAGLDLPVSIEGQDLMAAVTATGSVTENIGFQVRASYGQSSREYRARPIVDTGLEGAGVAFMPSVVQTGGDPAYPASLQRSDLTGQGTVHVRSGEHHLKVGGGFRLASHERPRITAGDGFYLFASPSDYAARSGVFWGATGSRTGASFSVPEFFAFGQDIWRAAPGLDITIGARYEVEQLPQGELSRNQRWAELTGVDNTTLNRAAGEATLVTGLDWDVREQHTWRVRGDVAIQIGDVAPELLGEALTYDGRITATGAVGDVTASSSLGPRLTILSSDLSPPVTTRASLGLSRDLGRGTAFHLGGVIRKTVNLPTRADLNLPVEAPYQDQYGRPVYGRLRSVGQLVYPEPGTNRRFGEFDAVSAIAANATSTYFGVTVGLEKRFGDLKAVGSYTYSSTRDDWLATPDKLPLDGLSPFPREEGVERWEEGISDFDVPHRLTLATELTLPFARMISVGGFWRIASGRPFTPGYGRAIDANGDGVAGNDPAFIDESIEGVAELQDRWDCLRTNAGHFAERNSCRLRARTLLDAWVSIRVPGLGPEAPELRIEAVGLDGEDVDRVDTALYRLDPGGTLTVDESTGEINMPLVVNPRFGANLAPVRELTRFRVSLTVVF